MNRVVIPIEGDFLSEMFNDCTSYQVYEIDNNEQISKVKGIPSQKISGKLQKLMENYGATDLIVHSIDRVSLKFFSETKLNLFIGVEIRKPEQLIEDYLKGTLKSNTLNISKASY